ncbi:YoaK family protein [Streptomyces sp. NPDC048845]|uniref:YoaK family protein n=1 Tax=Streptomyces sp. NPDC048845 TaxID=3155390 RepID=UPI003431559C
MLVLTFVTGVIDAIGYLGLDRVFAGNMTGNVVILGLGLAGADELPVLGPAVALGGFLAGAALAGRALRHSPRGTWTATCTWVLVACAVVLGAVAVLLLFEERFAPQLVAPGAACLMAIGMGAQASTARRLAVQEVTTVVVTSTLTGLAADSRFAGGGSPLWARRAGAVLAITAGAATGALLLLAHLTAGVTAAAVLTLAVAARGHYSVGVRSRRKSPSSPTTQTHAR